MEFVWSFQTRSRTVDFDIRIRLKEYEASLSATQTVICADTQETPFQAPRNPRNFLDDMSDAELEELEDHP
jgi:hypothetical protein